MSLSPHVLCARTWMRWNNYKRHFTIYYNMSFARCTHINVDCFTKYNFYIYFFYSLLSHSCHMKNAFICKTASYRIDICSCHVHNYRIKGLLGFVIELGSCSGSFLRKIACQFGIQFIVCRIVVYLLSNGIQRIFTSLMWLPNEWVFCKYCGCPAGRMNLATI